MANEHDETRRRLRARLLRQVGTKEHRKIEARRREAFQHEPLERRVANVVAIAADHEVPDAGVPVFALDDVKAIADFVARRLGLDVRGAQ